MSFKKMVEEDIGSVFLNGDEFAECHTVSYNGELYENIPLLLTKVKESEHPVVPSEGAPGIHKVSVVVHISLHDMRGKVPEQKQLIRIDDGEALGQPFFCTYRIVTSDVEMGMIVLELEAYDE